MYNFINLKNRSSKRMYYNDAIISVNNYYCTDTV